MMFDRHNKKSMATLAVGLVASMGLGGAAIANAAKTPSKVPAPPAATKAADTPDAPDAAEPAGGKDTDNVQSGDQTTPDSPASSSSKTVALKSAAAPSEPAGTE